MSTAPANVNARLAALLEAGVSPWLDQIRRNIMESGELDRMRREECLRGVTSNPAIFEKAILGSDDYDEQLAELAREGADAREIYRRIAVTDVQMACDVLRPVWDETSGLDGYVSLEVDPDLAFDPDRTTAQARELWDLVDRPNLMIKIPGTLEGIPAIEASLYDGINVNVTLLFAVEAYAEVCEAFIRAMERRRADGRTLDVHSVASFFVSRVDTEVDKRLDALGRPDLHGKAALANARAAYAHFRSIFHGDRFAALREAGCPVQRPLWASTGVKNPRYPDTMYVDGLIAPDTVNTMPLATLEAVADHGEVRGNTAEEDPTADLEALAEAGIDLKDVTDTLLTAGVDAFVTPMEQLLAGIEQKREAIANGRPPTIGASLPPDLERIVADEVARAEAEDVVSRIWHHDETLWGGPGPEIGDRLGWLTIAERMRDEAAELDRFARACREDGLTDAVLLGMGGSSLAPEVFRRSFPAHPGYLRLHVLDTTDAQAILELERSVPLDNTLFLVSSKSGGTIETLTLYEHFRGRVAYPSRFVASTAPGSGLAELAEREGFRATFLADPEIGGRYSALSPFGLVPAALMGADLGALLDGAEMAMENCRTRDGTHANSGLWLGCALAALAKAGRDKLTFVVSRPIASFGLWVEQLVAESTGKHGTGILPVADEPVGPPEVYGEDRVFAYLRADGDADEHLDGQVEALRAAGQPVVTLSVGGPGDLGRIMFFAELATAVAGWSLGVNPFDQPDVQAAKDATKQVLEASDPPPVADASYDELRSLLSQAAPPRYVAIMGYLAPGAPVDDAIRELRHELRDRTRAAVTFGYGPRFLHSTGQFHKGGPPTGLFLQLVHDGPEDAEIPGRDHGFTRLKHAQADGDLATLRDRGLQAERITLKDEASAGIRALTNRIRELLPAPGGERELG